MNRKSPDTGSTAGVTGSKDLRAITSLMILETLLFFSPPLGSLFVWFGLVPS